jgi:RNA polymerase sigma-70 factor (TIGR02960 family)
MGPDDAIARAVAGDENAFAAATEPHRRSVFRHCYRMLGSGLDAEEATQDTMLRAWRRLSTYDASGAFGGWLYRIATNVCLDRLRARPASPVEAEFVEPVDDRRLAVGDDPGDEVVRREDVSLAFVSALQRLAPRQRACLLLHDVLGFSVAEIGDALETSRTAVDTLLFRARAAVRRPAPGASLAPTDPALRELLERYIHAWRLADLQLFLDLVAADIRFSMPPLVERYEGRDAVGAFVEQNIFALVRPHGVMLYAGWCNGQPAFATYAPDASGRLVASGLQILDVDGRDGRPVITAIASYRDPELVPRCGLPASLT